PAPSTVPSGNSYICDRCGKSVASQDKLTRHYRNHNPHRPCPHDACNKKYAQKKELDRHIRSNHASWAAKHPELAGLSPINNIVCEDCGYTADRPDNVQRHIKKFNGGCVKEGK
ncbi:hypothetical protein M406DRAFT_92416, partial [Cryphonectria parasitica EP155]